MEYGEKCTKLCSMIFHAYISKNNLEIHYLTKSNVTLV